MEKKRRKIWAAAFLLLAALPFQLIARDQAPGGPEIGQSPTARSPSPSPVPSIDAGLTSGPNGSTAAPLFKVAGQDLSQLGCPDSPN